MEKLHQYELMRKKIQFLNLASSAKYPNTVKHYLLIN